MSKLNTLLPAVLLLAGIVAVAGQESAVAWLGPNLAPNPGFEKSAADGLHLESWSVQASVGADAACDSSRSIEGARSARLSSPRDGTNASLVSADIPVEGGCRYLFSMAFRQEGFNTGGEPDKFGGVSSGAEVHWLDGARRELGKSSAISRFPYGPSGWNLRDALELAPPNTKLARIRFWVSNDSAKHSGKAIPSTLWVDAAQLRKYLPPPTPDWAKGETARVVDGAVTNTRVKAYFAASDSAFGLYRGGAWSEVVDDPRAERGSALRARLNPKGGIMAHSPYWTALPPGLYRVLARVRAPASDAKGPLGHVDVDSQSSGSRMSLPIPPGGDAYQVLEGDFILRDSGWWDLRVWTDGGSEWSLDSLKVFCLSELEDRQLLSVYPGVEGQVPDDLKPALGGGPKPMTGLAVVGLDGGRLRLADTFHLLHRDAELKTIWARMSGGCASYSGLPEDAGELFKHPVIFLCDVNVRALGLKYKSALREYVRRGGALVVFGGHQAYERGGWGGSLLEEALPILTASSVAGGLTHFPGGAPISIDGMEGKPPILHYLHKVELKSGAKVMASAAGRPVVVGGEYGSGRVVCVLAIPWGGTESGGTPFWEWEGWPYFLRDACWWALNSNSM